MTIAVIGMSGKMGKRVLALAEAQGDFEVKYGIEMKGHPTVGHTMEGVPVTDDVAVIKECDCVIDFSSPKALENYLPHLESYQKAAVIGTTGLTPEHSSLLQAAGKKVPLVVSPNMSIGVNLLFKLVKICAQILSGYTAKIEEAHHVHKKDAPSGTAKKIAQVLEAQGFTIPLQSITAIRQDEIVGDHKIFFESEVDRIELFHSAKTRDIFAKGALIAAQWLVRKQPGVYSMEDVLFPS